MELSENCKIPNLKLIRTLRTSLILLFILSILSLFFALISLSFSLQDITVALTEKIYIFLFFLPIPIISIILAIYCKVKIKIIKCTKNIVAGVIMAFVLTIFGCMGSAFSYSHDYSIIKEVSETINFNLPQNGKVLTTDLVKNKNIHIETINNAVMLKTIAAKFTDNSQTDELKNAIDNSSIWKSELSNSLLGILPVQYFANNTISYLIYNLTTNKFNEMPTENGKYTFYYLNYKSNSCELYLYEYEVNFIV